ncbi:MAG: hypothetical protein AAF492_31470, partial [Verrucomicrobiota bacterium]
ELYNTGTTNVDLNFWSLVDEGTNPDNALISNGGPLIIRPGEFLIMGNSGDFADNGGVNYDYVYCNCFVLKGGAGDQIILLNRFGREVTRLDYDGGPDFPNPPEGASMYLISPDLDHTVGANWAVSTSNTNWPGNNSGDFGSPGGTNEVWGVMTAMDSDGDGCTDESEINIFLTDPMNSNDCPQILSYTMNGGMSRLEYHSISGKLSFIDVATSLTEPVTWTQIGVISNAQPTATFTDTANAGNSTNPAFYRVRMAEDL